MSVFPPNRYHEVEPGRVQHGRSFVTAHQPSSVLLSANPATSTRPQQQAANGHSGKQRDTTLPMKNVTLSTSMRSSTGRGDLTNTSLGSSQRMHNNTTKLNSTLQRPAVGSSPVPSSLLHPNHITDVFPDALSSLTKTDEHTYSGSHHAAHDRAHHAPPSVQHSDAYTLSNSHAHHKIPLRMPSGPHIAPTTHDTLQSTSNLFDPHSMSGMEDSTYGPSASGAASGTPALAASLSSDRVVPLQRENLRLVRSNNALQAHLVAEGERIDECEREWAQEMRTIKTKHADLQFLFAQKSRKLSTQEQKIAELQSRLEQVLSDRQAYVKESIESTARLQPAAIQATTSFRASEHLHPSEVDQVRAHENRIADLTAEVAAHAARAADWETERSVLLSKVSTRDEEVKRLADVLESERNWDKMQVEFDLRRHVKTIAKLEQQIDYLNDQRVNWERDTKSYQEMGVNETYMKQLEEARQQAQQSQAEHQQTRERLHQLQAQIDHQQQQLNQAEASKRDVNEHAQEMLQERDRQMQELQQKYDQLLSDNEQRGVHIDTLQTQLEQTRSQLPSIDVPLLQENYKREEHARTALREQYTKLVREHDEIMNKFNQTTNELSELKASSSRDLSALQSDLLRAQYLNDDFQRRLRDLSETKAHLSEESGVLKSKVELTERVKEGLGGERDYYKTQVHELNGTIQSLRGDLQQRSDEIVLLQRQLQSQEAQVHEGVKDRSRILHEHQQDAAAIRSLESTINDLRADLEQAQRQNANLNEIVVEKNEMMTNLADMNVTQRGLVRTNDKMKTQIDALTSEKSHLFDRLALVTSERDSLLQSLSSTDSNLVSIQTEITHLHAERESKEDAYANLYHDYTDVSEQLAEAKQSKIPSLQAQIASLTQETARLQSKLSEVQDLTVPKLTQTDHHHRQEIAHLKTAYAELQKRLESEQEVTNELNTTIARLQHELDALHFQSSAKKTQLDSSVTLLSHHTDLISKLNLQIGDLKSVCRTVESQKSKLESELQHQMRDNEEVRRELAAQVEANTNQSVAAQSKGQALVELNAQINDLTEAKAQLEIDLQEQTMQVQQLQNEARLRHESTFQLTSVVNDTTAQTAALQEMLRAKEHELSDLSRQLHQAQRDLSRVTEESVGKSSELSAILQDLENMIQENQVLTRQLDSLQSTSESRSTDAERLTARLSQTEEMYRAKEVELLDLLSNYRVVCLENERIKLSADELEQERANFRATIKQQQDGIFKQETQLRACEGELRKRMVDIQSLERAVQEVSRASESQKKQLDAAISDKADLSHALDSSRHLSVGFEHSHQDHLRVIAEYKSQVSQQQGDLHSLQMDNTHLLAQLQQAKDHAHALDKVIADLRGQNALSVIQATAITSDTTTTAPSSSPSPASPSAAHESLLAQVRSLQSTVDAQFQQLSDLHRDRAKLKGFIVKYEEELAGMEDKLNQSQQAATQTASPRPSPYSPAPDASVADSFHVQRA